MVEWISAIPFEDWPQQTRLDDGKIRPAMVNDLGWHGFGHAMASVTQQVRTAWPAIGLLNTFMLSVVMPGHSIPPHADQQEPGWITRVHVPLLSNDLSAFWFKGWSGDIAHVMPPGGAYLVDVTQKHWVTNKGETPRIHFMFDVFGGG
jgi:hypothetical protein